MNIPLQVKLRKETHRKIAYAQDMIIEEVYKFLPNAILHGGTAIWRIYSGKRFSEDLDLYLTKEIKKIEELFDSLEKKGFKIIKKKISENSVYSELEFDRTSVRLEATFQNVHKIISDYELSDGNKITIYSISVEDFIIEKIKAYIKRCKIRDLWDIFFLLKEVKDKNKIKPYLKQLTDNYKKPPDEEDLKTIILEGIVPTSQEMLGYIKQKWEK